MAVRSYPRKHTNSVRARLLIAILLLVHSIYYQFLHPWGVLGFDALLVVAFHTAVCLYLHNWSSCECSPTRRHRPWSNRRASFVTFATLIAACGKVWVVCTVELCGWQWTMTSLNVFLHYNKRIVLQRCHRFTWWYCNTPWIGTSVCGDLAPVRYCSDPIQLVSSRRYNSRQYCSLNDGTALRRTPSP